MKQVSQQLSQTISTDISQRNSKLHLPQLNKESKVQLTDKHDQIVKQQSKNEIISFRQLDNIEQDQKNFFEAYSTSSTQSSIMRYPRARSVTSNERNSSSQDKSKTSKQKTKNNNSFILISKLSGLRQRPQINNINKNDRSSSSSIKDQEIIKVQTLLNNQRKFKFEKKEKGWDQYKDLLTKEVQRSSVSDKASHLTTTPLVNYKNFFDRKREIESNLSLQSSRLNECNYSVLDKRTKTFFTSQCKEEAKEFQQTLKQNERKLNLDLQELVQRQKHQLNRKQYSNKYCISKHIESNPFVNPQLIF